MNTPATKVKVAIVGCGLIGALWDAPESAKEYSLTHAAAFSKHREAELLAFVDADLARAQAACQRWGVAHAYSDLAQMLAEIAPDIVVIATASQARLALLQPVLAAKTALCIIEKPLASTLEESQAMVSALAASQTLSLVNFSRHWDHSLSALGEQLRAGAWGQVQRMQAWYGKGLSNNGSHMIDLVGNLLAAKPMRVRGRASPLPESESAWCEGRDKAVDAQIIYQNGAQREWQLDLLACDQSAFTCFELRIMAQHAIIEISKGARQIALTPIVDDPNFANYRIPGEAQILPAGYLQAMDNMAHEAIRLVQARRSGNDSKAVRSSCDAIDALHTALTVAAIKQSCAQGESWQDVTN